jgi:hypothetical protein
MRSFVSPFAASAVLAIAILSSNGASAQAAAEPVICAPLTDAAPALLSQSCTALIDNPATADATRLDAMITALPPGSGRTDSALAEIAVIAGIPLAPSAPAAISARAARSGRIRSVTRRSGRSRQRQRLRDPRQHLQQCRQI